MKLSLFTDDMTFYIQLPLHSKESKRQLLQLSEFSLLHYNINIKNCISVYQQQKENKIFSISFTWALKNQNSWE